MKNPVLISKTAVTMTLLLSACVTSEDPADGGFFNGVNGLAGGGYQARVDEREENLGNAQARNSQLRGQHAALRGQHSNLKSEIIQKRAALRANGVKLTAASERDVQEVISDNPQSAAALRRAIADARALSAELTRLSG
jgi:hypothetical protein